MKERLEALNDIFTHLITVWESDAEEFNKLFPGQKITLEEMYVLMAKLNFRELQANITSYLMYMASEAKPLKDDKIGVQ